MLMQHSYFNILTLLSLEPYLTLEFLLDRPAKPFFLKNIKSEISEI